MDQGGRSAAQVQKVQKVQRVQRVVVAASPQFLKKGVRLTAQVGADYVGRLCRRVVFASLRGRYRRFAAMSIKTALRDYLPVLHRHPERSEGSR